MEFLLYLSIIPALGLAAQWLAWRTNLPSILLLLLFGVALGQFVKPDSYFAELTGGGLQAGPEILFPIVSLSVAVIMFEGGLSLKLSELREAGGAALRLCTIGALITWAGATIGAFYCLNFSWQVSSLLGAILVVTGPTVIGPILRQVRPSKRVSATLKWEGIVIDPIGAILAVLVFEQALLHAGEATFGSAMVMLAKTTAIGTLLGVAGGWMLTSAFKRFWVPDQLQGVGALSVGLLLFAISNTMAHESGLITVTVLGLWLTNQHGFEIAHIIEFKENLRTLLIGCLFIVLGSRVDLADVAAIGWPGLAFLLILILLVRPLAVFISLIGSKLTYAEQAFVAGLAPRGIVAAAVSSVFALELERKLEGFALPGADQLATVTFLVIVGTVTVYGLSAAPLASWLGLADSKSNGVLIVGADAWVREFALQLQKSKIPVVLVDTNYNKVTQAKVAGLTAVCANILNEHAREELPLAGIGSFMAMTPNDEVNTLAVKECQHIFGRSGAYQLSFTKQNSKSRRGMTKNLMGRELFNEGTTFSSIKGQVEIGSTFRSTTLSEEFSYADFLKRHQGGATLMCAIDEDKHVIFKTVGDDLHPQAGQTIIALVSSTPIPDDHASQA
ncbi:cation:proton antiporter [Rubripirellula amarantea]|uniref:K(+)/H(+) antiporter NhaP2 n=1 Tax=Rubripirellula amarantea TaxID=2527999 RepID=A0A5C5WK32_9BACT|nr:sodium:proton antiporter [Rubripirellula amarantea]MDA8744516.1 cation:proton antiporter [Rubripirellula amarantea]TWT51174.1 K(+)/H(+) antiporter NhaP2 [Rubripirellula amarantea]